MLLTCVGKTCVDIREPLHMGWCNSKWVNCVNDENLPETSETSEVAIVKEMWKDTGCTTTTLPLDTLGRYVSLQSKGNYQEIAQEMLAWCKCAQMQNNNNVEYFCNIQDTYDKIKASFAFDACQPDRAKTCTEIKAFNRYTTKTYLSDPRKLRTCVGGFFEQKHIVRTQEDSLAARKSLQNHAFRKNLAKTRRKHAKLFGAYESEECGNIGAGTIHGNGELERWIKWSEENLNTDAEKMPSYLKLASFSTKTYVTGNSKQNLQQESIGTVL